ncbi:MAG: glycosyltransferase family 2 protein [Acidobacteriota bacterium]|nr:glycosyltransferase family 2 protein [Acidobacteriota bacterium]
MRISVVIPTHNRAEALALTLSNLAKLVFDEPWELIVTNNRCTDGTDALVKRQRFPVPLRLIHEETPGPAAARNAGARQAQGQYVLFMDNDILVQPDFLRRHLNALESHPGCWVVGQVVNLPEQESTPFGRFRKSLFPFIPVNEPAIETDAITGQNMSLPHADFEALGGFDESFFVASGEDRELLYRAKKLGIKLILDPGIVVLHNDWAGSTIQDFCFRTRLYCQTEPLFWRKYGDAYPRQKLVKENSAPSWQADPLSLILWKQTKKLLGGRAGQTTLLRACEIVERMWPWPPLLWRLYRLAVAGAMYKGFQEGAAINQNGSRLSCSQQSERPFPS